jgi:hypothetical protein
LKPHAGGFYEQQGYAEIIGLGWVCGYAANPTQTISFVVVRRQARRVLIHVLYPSCDRRLQCEAITPGGRFLTGMSGRYDARSSSAAALSVFAVTTLCIALADDRMICG